MFIDFLIITCLPLESRMCMVDTQQLTCLSIQGITPTIKNIACDVATTNPVKQKTCNAVFKSLEKMAETACGISYTLLCDVDRCPENHDATSCKRKRAAGPPDF